MRREHIKHIAILSANLMATAFLYISFINSLSTPATAQKQAVLSATKVETALYPQKLLTQTAKQINDYRETNGPAKLRQSPALDKIAQARADDMQKHGYYAHLGSDGYYFSDLMKQQGIAYRYACENLNISDSPTAQGYLKSWVASPAHKNCLLHGSITSAGYAEATIRSMGGVAVNETIIVAIYADVAE